MYMYTSVASVSDPASTVAVDSQCVPSPAAASVNVPGHTNIVYFLALGWLAPAEGGRGEELGSASGTPYWLSNG